MPRIRKYWANYFRSTFLPEIDTLSKWLMDRILPTFDNIGEEASRVEKEEYERLGSLSIPDDDEATAQSAFDKGAEHYMRLYNMRQGIINMFTAGLYHLFEQQLINFYRLELLGIREKIDKNLTIEMVQKRLAEDIGLDITEVKSWPIIYGELRPVAHTVKHADGSSAKVLKEIRPNLFIEPTIPQDLRLLLEPGPVFKPLFGEDLYVTLEDFNLYVKGIKDFWYELSDIIRSDC